MAELLARWRAGLAKTSHEAFGRLAAVLGATEINSASWQELESILLQADVGGPTSQEIVDHLQRVVQERGLRSSDELRAALREELVSRLVNPPAQEWSAAPQVILIVGVNGSGKTTTIAKLIKRFKDQGKTVLVGAADTFRAAAKEQLGTWAERLEVDMISGAPESDPAAVAFNAVQAGAARGIDIVMIDTAGRLHTRSNLMEELKKIRRVLGKALSGAPHAVWLVLDATTGQNALSQAAAFKDAVSASGVILAKLDSSAKGGMALAIGKQLGLPILFAGVGEGTDDLVVFDRDAFVAGILE